MLRSSCYFWLVMLIVIVLPVCLPKLQYLATTFRHGARYPSSGGYDIYDSNQTKEFAGRLTSVGMRQLYLLGSYLKTQYIDRQRLINVTMFNKEVEVFSDSTQRCIESGICFMLGLFPFGTGPRIPQNLSQVYLQPPFESFLGDNVRKNLEQKQIRYQDYYEIDMNDFISKKSQTDFGLKYGFQPTSLFVKTSLFQCSGENALVAKKLQEVKVKLRDFGVEQAEFINRMKLVFNLKQEYVDLIGMTDLYDLAICDLYLGRPLPPSFTDQDMKHLTYIQAYLYPLVYSNTVASIFATPLLVPILSNMNNIIKNGIKQVKRLSVYSGHDTNVVAIMSHLNLTSAECIMKQWKNQSYEGNCGEIVPFGSNLIFQLHSNENEGDNDQKELKDGLSYYVKVRYNGEYMDLCERKMKECEFLQFEARVKRDFVNMDELCPVKKNEREIYEQLKRDENILILSQ